MIRMSEVERMSEFTGRSLVAVQPFEEFPKILVALVHCALNNKNQQTSWPPLNIFTDMATASMFNI